jgi:arginyl-tRNA synthetase
LQVDYYSLIPTTKKNRKKSTMTEEAKGPSKNDLKKAAKKDAKAAMKQALKGGDAGVVAGGGGGAKETPAAAAPSAAPATVIGAAAATTSPSPPPIAATPKLLLYNGTANCPATLKAVWAAQHYQVQLGVAQSKDLPVGFASNTKKPALIYGNDYVLGGGGNAMCKAIALLGSGGEVPGAVRQNSFVADEWCEMERTSLRIVTDTSAALKALEHLSEQGLQKSTGIHLVGDSDTMADVCILVTLATTPVYMDCMAQWPASVVTYYKAHADALERAKTAVSDYLPTPPIDWEMDPRLLQVITAVFTKAIDTLFPTAEISMVGNVKQCANPKHGDYQCTAAMPIFGALKKNGTLPSNIASPQDVAAALILQVQHDAPSCAVVTELTVQGPGFILCRVSASYLQGFLQTLVQTGGQLPKPSTIVPQQCLVDFSSPNIAKEMHVGHLRSTIIGEAVCRILEFVGHSVARVNHVGDWGTQFGMLIQYLKEGYPNFARDMPNITDLTGFYKAAKERFDADADFKKTSQINVVKLQSGDAECLGIWKILCDISRQEFQKVYDRLDVTLHEFGESYYNDKIPPVLQEFEQAGLIRVEDGGAKCVFVDGFQNPLMLQKSDGGYGYDSTDMAALKHRLFTICAKRIIVITDFSQGDHFKMCYNAAHQIGWVNQGQSLEHIGFGTVQGEDGKRFKTRSGDTVRLVDLLDEAVKRMNDSLLARIQEGKANITVEEVPPVAEAIGYGAVKYFDLSRNPTSNYKFSYDAMLDTKGDTAVYLLYARVRLESIVAKGKAEHNVDVEELVQHGTPLLVIEHESERKLALQLQQFSDVLELTLEDLFPYHICGYLYNVAIAASEFVTQCRVLGSPEMKSRLLLCHITTLAMEQCFDLLAIRRVKRI